MIPSAVREIFVLSPIAFFLHEVGWDPMHQQGQEKFPGMVGIFPQWEKKRLPVHGPFSTAAPVT